MSVGKEGYQQPRPYSRKNQHRKFLRHFPIIFAFLILVTAGGCIYRSPQWIPTQQLNAGRINAAPVLRARTSPASTGKSRADSAKGPPSAALPRRPEKPRASPDAPPQPATTVSTSARVDLEWLARKIPFPLDPPSVVDPSADGRLVRHLCNTGKAEHLIFVHTDPTHARERKLFRSTVGHPRIASLFKWSMLFLVGTRPDVNITDEATQYGDIVQLPFMDHYRNLSLKFLYGMRWVMLNCPSVRSLVKIDDDVFIHPELLDAYLRTRITANDRRLHCSTFRGNAVIRNPHSRHYLSRTDYPKKYFPMHCHGWFVVIPSPIMWDLYVAAFRVPFHAIDDAYVTGDLAKTASLGHADISPVLSADEDRLLELLRGEYMCALFTGRTKLNIRVTLWKTLTFIKKRQDLDLAMQSTLKAFKQPMSQ
ncbi:acetylgalactosaminyl-O-glycosyl-glycoprotein beta-1,3-N-acetylglucosaminyltransferase-like [Dermacentor albipictus]|uniref:acetylgalactosaminyl-O-glycosyl-glycoprotein beta-1,3-N-acetylglucosaminyltransferase-like n=1 Tax=Dermacentor albipictus TaxID=60249 RepID=UPI0031FC5926